MSDFAEMFTNVALLLAAGMVILSLAAVWLLGRARGRREGFAEVQQILKAGYPPETEQNERIDSLFLEMTRLRENQSQMSKVLRAAVQSSVQQS